MKDGTNKNSLEQDLLKHTTLWYIQAVEFSWNLGKNTKLKEERGISFEQIVKGILSGNFKVHKNPSANHPGQFIFEVQIRKRVWRVPFKKTRKAIHLFTIFPRDEK